MITNRLTPALILRELGKMNIAEVDGVLQKLQRLSATKKGALRATEARLLETINSTLSTEQRSAYRRLSAKRATGDLSPAEHRELIRLSDLVEGLHARRLQSLVKLAAIRKVTLTEVMRQLGLKSLATHG